MVFGRSSTMNSRPDAPRAATELRRFNRYEIKYLMPEEAIGAFCARLEQRMDRDRYQSRATHIEPLLRHA